MSQKEEIEAVIAPPNKAKVGDLALPAFPFMKKVKYPGGPPAVAKLITEKAQALLMEESIINYNALDKGHC